MMVSQGDASLPKDMLFSSQTKCNGMNIAMTVAAIVMAINMVGRGAIFTCYGQ